MNRKILLLCGTDTAQHVLGHYYVHHQEPVKLPLQPLVSVWMWRCKCSQPWSVWRAPDDGFRNARTMLSSVCTTK